METTHHNKGNTMQLTATETEMAPTAAQLATLEMLKSAIEFAPLNPPPSLAPIKGYWTKDGWYLCDHCAGRIMARGCRLPSGSEPVWEDADVLLFGVCCLHEVTA